MVFVRGMVVMIEFQGFPKIPRLSRECIITEKLDGTNAQVYITEQTRANNFTNEVYAGSRNRMIDTKNDNYGFAKWVEEHKEELLELGPGRHFGEWWGKGIQRGYNLDEKRFSLFNVGRWNTDNIPKCCHIVPILWQGLFDTIIISNYIEALKLDGSYAAPYYMNPEGIIIYHVASGYIFKKTIDDSVKG